MYIIDKLIENKVEIRNGLWVVAKPLGLNSIKSRLKDAWAVYTGTAVAVKFLEDTINGEERRLVLRVLDTENETELVEEGLWGLKDGDRFQLIENGEKIESKGKTVFTVIGKPFINSKGRIAANIKE